MRFTKLIIFLGFFSFLITVFLAQYKIVGQAVYGDGIAYWGYTRSFVLSGNSDLTDELAHFYSPESNNSFSKKPPLKTNIPLVNEFTLKYPPGTAVMWVPFFITSQNIVLGLGMLGFLIPANGFSDIYQIGVSFGVIGFVIVGMTVNSQFLKHFFTQQDRTIALITILFGTSLFYYTSLNPLSSHAVSFLLTSLLLTYWFLTLQRRDSSSFIILGILTGFTITTRTQDIVFALLFFWKFIFFLRHGILRKEIPQMVLGTVLFGCGVTIGLLPQLFINYSMLGMPLHIPYMEGDITFDFQKPHLLEMITDTKAGLLYFSPILLVAFVGLIFFARRYRFVGTVILSILIVEYYLIASWNAWDQAASYGNRMLISTYPILTIGLCEMIKRVKKYFSFPTILALCLFFIIQNVLMIGLFKLFLQEPTFIQGEVTSSGQLKQHIIEFLSRYL